jgi:hypothetical protein
MVSGSLGKYRRIGVTNELPPEWVESVARAMASADGLDYDEVCGVDDATQEGFCDSGTCVSAHWEEHDAEQARRWYNHLATAAINAMLPHFEQAVAKSAKDGDSSDYEANVWEQGWNDAIDYIASGEWMKP